MVLVLVVKKSGFSLLLIILLSLAYLAFESKVSLCKYPGLEFIRRQSPFFFYFLLAEASNFDALFLRLSASVL